MTRLLFPTAFAFAATAWTQTMPPGCKPVFDAMAKIYAVPVHMYSTETAGYLAGKTRTSESIYLNHAAYIQVNGKWRTSPTTQEDLRNMKKDQPEKNVTCRAVRDESVSGENAALYNVHQATPDSTIDTQIWVSKSRGLPLKSEINMDVGGKFGKSHRITRYEYTNVQPPAGLH
ncbi:MAG TPA: hypothetical protein VKT81_15025 [Bryobacteraceae bacterium]|nr:hypothetical protein [Bryobacteraceae bacterium]